MAEDTWSGPLAPDFHAPALFERALAIPTRQSNALQSYSFGRNLPDRTVRSLSRPRGLSWHSLLRSLREILDPRGSLIHLKPWVSSFRVQLSIPETLSVHLSLSRPILAHDLGICLVIFFAAPQY